MSQGNEQEQECFVPAYWQQISYPTNFKDVELPELNINKLLQQAKQLHNRSKPKQLVSRTCFLQLPFQKLPDYLQQPCVQQQFQQGQNSPFTPIQNDEHLSIQEYFNSHQLIYNKMKMYTRPCFQLSDVTSRFKPISHLSDFHEKLFKQLGTTDMLRSTTRIAINDQFDSNFQCGNLGMVYKKQDTMDREYFLLLENDVNSHGYTSWFFFKVKSCGKGIANFHIVNLSKSSYLYRIGFKISIFSVQKFNLKGTRWFKGGKNIQTYATNFQKKKAGGQKYNSLYFQYQFDENQSEVYFAMSQPYTYTSLIKDMQSLENKLQNSQIKWQSLKSIYSISCNIIPVIVLSKKNQEANKQLVQIQDLQLQKDKKALIFMARQHPGEVVGSNFMRKIMELFGTDMEEVSQLINKFTIIFIPMVNPDGVIHGNSRCNLAGLDLNRQWMKQCIKEVTPQTSCLRKLIWSIQQSVGIQYFVDFHGHSKKMNSFFFSNKLGDKYPSQYLPYTICKINKKFDIFSCTFNTTPDKKNTLRNQLYQNGMKNCITVQNSYFGYWQQKNAKLFKDPDYQQMAFSILKAISLLFVGEEQISVVNFAKNIGFSREQLYNQIRNYKQLSIKKSYKYAEENDIESDSDPEGDIMKPEQMLKIYEYETIIPQKKLSFMRKKKKNSRLRDLKNMQQKDDQLRTSEPMKINKQLIAVEPKVHQSEKKLQPNTNKSMKTTTQQKFRQQPRSLGPAVKRFSTKKQTVIKQTVLSMNQQQQQSIKQLVDDKSKIRALGPPFNKLQKLDDQNNKSRKRRIQSRLRTEVETEKPKNYSQVHGNYGKLKQQSIQAFLNQTLSIAKVNKNGVQQNVKLGFQELSRRKNSLKSEKYLNKSHRFQVQNQHSTAGLQIDTSLKRQSIAEQRVQRKKHLSYNYKKQLTRRKKVLASQATNSKYKKFEKFQKFTQNSVNEVKKQDVKLQCNSVFYYFPVL